eukprot:g6747.t1
MNYTLKVKPGSPVAGAYEESSSWYILHLGGFHLYTPEPENTRVLAVPYNVWDFTGGQGPADAREMSVWDRPLLDHIETRSNGWNNVCAETTSGTGADNPGFWYVKFKDNQKRRISKIRIWGLKGGGLLERHSLDRACVRYITSADGTTLPPKENPTTGNCDKRLPERLDTFPGSRSGTEVQIDDKVFGLMIITTQN